MIVKLAALLVLVPVLAVAFALLVVTVPARFWRPVPWPSIAICIVGLVWFALSPGLSW